jgi:hypothetical protein
MHLSAVYMVVSMHHADEVARIFLSKKDVRRTYMEARSTTDWTTSKYFEELLYVLTVSMS